MRKSIMLLVAVLAIGVSTMAKTNVQPATVTSVSEQTIKDRILAELSLDVKKPGVTVNVHDGKPASFLSDKATSVKMLRKVLPATCIDIYIFEWDIYDENGEYVGTIVDIYIFIYDCPGEPQVPTVA
ncbi:MAG: hypothetical protein J7621_08090 [Niastella sp.]|nr:hypothetical protein [Niastella sp.]